MKFDDSSIKRVFRRDKKDSVKANKIEFILNGILQEKPTEAIKQFLNPFLLDQDFFSRKSELERNRYFVELFDVDTSQIDKDITTTEQAARDLRSVISAYGEIDITPVEKTDTYALAKERQQIIDQYQSDLKKNRDENKKISDINKQFDNFEESIRVNNLSIKEMQDQIKKMEAENNEYRIWIKNNPKKDLLPDLPLPNTVVIDEKISEAKAQNERHKRYIENKERYDEKKRKQLELSEMETQLRELRTDKIKKLAEVSDKCNVPGLRFDENANALYEGTALGMLSMSQVMRLSSALSALYPAGFGLELIDRGESLGKSIYGFIEKAKREESAILATIVGEKPAQVPDEVGVWVVEEGKIK